MTKEEFDRLRSLSWRRALSAEEESRVQSWLAAHPEDQADAEAEASLGLLLRQLPEAPVASNFTARVLQAVERDSRLPVRPPPARDRLKEWIRRLAPRAKWVALVLALLLLAQLQYQSLGRRQSARELLDFGQAASMTEPGLLQDFDAIQQLGQVPPVVDEELWLALNNIEANNP